MRLPRFRRFLGSGEGDWVEYTQAGRDEWSRRSNEEWWAREERRKKEEDIRRGSWVVSPKPTVWEEREWRDLRYDNILWANVQKTDENGKPWEVWEITDPKIKARFDKLDEKRQQHINTDNYQKRRLPPSEYYAVKDHVLTHGIGIQPVRFETASDGFKYLRVDFPDDYKWLLNNEFGRSEQAKNPAGYHITICEPKTYDTDQAAKQATDHLEGEYGRWQEIEMNEITISSGDTYQIEGNSQFAQDLRETVAITMRHKGAGYKAHISMD